MSRIVLVLLVAFVTTAHAESRWPVEQNEELVNRAYKSFRGYRTGLDKAMLHKRRFDALPRYYVKAAVARGLSDDEGGSLSDLVKPKSAGDVKKNSFIMLKGAPCKVLDLSVSKTGKHGHAKVALSGKDIFTGRAYEDSYPSHHNMEEPVVVKTTYTLMGVDTDSGEVSLMDENSEPKDGLTLPSFADNYNPTDDMKKEDAELDKKLIDGYNAGQDVKVIVLSANNFEKIVTVKVIDVE